MDIRDIFDCIMAGDLNGVKALIKSGVDIEARDHCERTALYIASLFGGLEIVKLLVNSGAKLDVKCRGLTALYIASSFGDLEIVKILAESGADIESMNKHGNTALNEASITGELEVVKYLIQRGADIGSENGSENGKGMSTYDREMKRGDPEIIELMDGGGTATKSARK